MLTKKKIIALSISLVVITSLGVLGVGLSGLSNTTYYKGIRLNRNQLQNPIFNRENERRYTIPTPPKPVGEQI